MNGVASVGAPVAPLSCAILILNYNGIKHLEPLLPTVREAVARHPSPVSVVVVDNRSTEPDVAYVREHFPEFEVVVAERNDYLFSLNPVVEARPEDVVILLNNDMRVDPGFIAPLLQHFRDPDLFFVSPAIYNWDGTECTNGQRVPMAGLFWCSVPFDTNVAEPRYTLEAGVGAFRRDRFVALGGYDPLYRPGYWEDVDLSYRAWERGWKCIFEPRSKIYHRIGGTFADQVQALQLGRVGARNWTLFTIKNVGGWGHMLAFLMLLPARAARQVVLGNRDYAWGAAAAVAMLPRALSARVRGRKERKPPLRAIEAMIRRAVSQSEPPGTPSGS